MQCWMYKKYIDFSLIRLPMYINTQLKSQNWLKIISRNTLSYIYRLCLKKCDIYKNLILVWCKWTFNYNNITKLCFFKVWNRIHMSITHRYTMHYTWLFTKVLFHLIGLVSYIFWLFLKWKAQEILLNKFHLFNYWRIVLNYRKKYLERNPSVCSKIFICFNVITSILWALRPYGYHFLWDMNDIKWCNGFYIEFRQSFAKETYSYDEHSES